jgi:hypothetical protein
MKKNYFFVALAVAILLGGCSKQNKLNGEKIEVLSQRIVQLEAIQAKQGAEIQTQLNSLAPMLDKMNSAYFAKDREDAFFYHTNTLYLLLTVGRKISSQLEIADMERATESSLAFHYHTNETDTMFFCTAQIQDALATQEKRIEDNVNAETRRVGATLADALDKQIKLDETETASRTQMAADLAQIRRDLEQIKARLAITNATNASAARP